MIELSAQQQLALLFPKSNKAIIETLEKASPQQLQTLSEAKDIKSVISQLMSDTLDVSKSNTIILDILKNSVFFKELGNFSKELQTLIQLLTQGSDEPNGKLEKMIKALQNSLLDFSDKDSSKLKEFINNSGVFLESKLSQELDPKEQLKTSLQTLENRLSQSEIPQVKNLVKEISALLQNTGIFGKTTDTTSLNSIKNEVDKLLSQLKDILRVSDPIHSKGVERSVTALEQFAQSKVEKSERFSVSQLNRLVQDLSGELRSSQQDGTKGLLSQLQSIENKVQEIQKGNETQTLIKSMLNEIESFDAKNLSKEQLKEVQSSLQKLKLMSQMKFHDLEGLNPNELKTFFTDLSQNIPSKTNSIFDLLEKILSSLKQPLASFEQQNIPQDIKNWLNNFHKELSKGDIVYSKSMQELLTKIEHFSKPAHLLNNSLLQESLQKDMKAILLGLEKELAGTSTNIEVLKSVDKLLVQIDYFQLLSHLSNASYLYIPYTWDQLENGNLSFKKSKDGSSYCEIDLELSEYGKLNMMLQLFEDNQLNIMIYTQKKELKALFKDNMKSLRSALVSVNIMPRNIHLHDLNEESKKSNPYQGSDKLNELGFEVKG